jgi:O-methyltransferase involved in polyketide biosynthesis
MIAKTFTPAAGVKPFVIMAGGAAGPPGAEPVPRGRDSPSVPALPMWEAVGTLRSQEGAYMADGESRGPEAGKEKAPRGVDTSVAHIARIYDYWLGGKDNFAADRHAGEQTIAAFPAIRQAVRGRRAFLGRAVRYLVAEAGIRQFLDIGTGLPAANNVHEVAQSLVPECRIVYVDNDPLVISHAHALLKSSAEGDVAYIGADLRDTSAILAEAADTLDFSQPTAVLLIGVLQFIPDEDDPYGIVGELMRATVPGSFVTIAHPARDLEAEAIAEFLRRYNELATEKAWFRSYAEISRFFDGLELVEPGVVKQPRWRPDTEVEANYPTAVWAGMARRPV